MEFVTLACPHCGFSKEMDAARIPPPGTRATCPCCRGVFTVEERPARPASGTEATSAPPPDRDSDAPPRSPVPPVSASRRRTLSFEFTGNAKEYFGIWIVNTLLRIVTLGIYSPWAKVRKRRYFYANTLLDNAPFDYLADPIAILKGWIIAGLFFAIYSIGSQASPLLGGFFMLVFLGLFPWVVVRSRIFNLRNSSHRNIRFGFNPDYREAYRVFLGWQLLAVLSLGILAPMALYRQKRFLVENSSYGTTRFSFHATVKDYYRTFIPLAVTVGIAALVVGFAAVSGIAAPTDPLNGLLAVPLFVLFLVFYYIVGVWLPTQITNVTWSATRIGDQQFRCSLQPLQLAWIYISNAIAIPLSLGLLAPWAAVRIVRYRLENVTLTGAGLASVARAAEEAVDAAGEELGDMLGFDLGL